jgi:hypothetical protein
MTRTIRSALTLLAGVPLFVAGALAAPASATTVDVANFSGSWQTHGLLPHTFDGSPATGPYSCQHSAHSVECSAIVDSDAAKANVRICVANLNSGTTGGNASGYAIGFTNIWSCTDGWGSGSFSYKPDPTAPPLTFPVDLTVQGGFVQINGFYRSDADNRTVVVRAYFPAYCSSDVSSAEGFVGTVNPV